MAPDPIPWQRFSSPLSQWEVLPSFVVGELTFTALALIALAHAVWRGRDHVLIWVAALVAGTANDLIFMALPLVDNFWQAQGTVMLSPRMPLYIPFVYVCFMYIPTVTVRRLGLARWPTAALTGLMAMLFYAPYDIVGAKFLWWTWHDTDPPIAARLLGAPCSSTLWVLTFTGAFGLLVDWTLRGVDRVGSRELTLGFFRVAGLTTALMMVQMTVLQQVDGGTPRYGALLVGIAIYAFVAWRGRRSCAPRQVDRRDTVLRTAVFVHLSTLLATGMYFLPETHVSDGLHQPTGPCYVEESDITGQTRHAWLCVSDFEEDFTFDCTGGPPEGSARWYTICGREHSARHRWLAGLGALCLGGAIAFGAAWRRR